MKLTLREKPGRCRWCGCTHEHACDGGCGWANRQQTLCSACAGLDTLMRTASGRAELARRWQEVGE